MDNNEIKIPLREITDLMKGLNKDDRTYIYNYIKKKSKTDFIYEHSFIIEKKDITEDYNIDGYDYGEFKIPENIHHNIRKIKKLKKFEKGLQIDRYSIVLLSDNKTLTDEELSLIENELIKKIEKEIENKKYVIECYKDLIKKSKKFLNSKFKKEIRLKKLNNIIDESEE